MANGDALALEDRIALLSSPLGDAASLRERDAAAQYLLEHADAAYPELLRRLASGGGSNPLAIIALLPRFGREASIPVLAQWLGGGDELVAPVSARALAEHPQASALQALLAALGSTHAMTAIAAADALAGRGQPDACTGLRDAMGHADAQVRYHLVQAAASLHCLSVDELRSIGANDVDVEVQALAQRLLDAAGRPAPP
jgi:HEAT repeat protein